MGHTDATVEDIRDGGNGRSSRKRRVGEELLGGSYTAGGLKEKRRVREAWETSCGTTPRHDDQATGGTRPKGLTNHRRRVFGDTRRVVAEDASTPRK